MKKLTESEQRAKELMERFIKVFGARMKREGLGKYDLLPTVATELYRTVRTIESWLSRSGPNPKDILVVRAVESWCEKEEEK